MIIYPELGGKDVEDLFTAVLSPASTQPAPLPQPPPPPQLLPVHSQGILLLSKHDLFVCVFTGVCDNVHTRSASCAGFLKSYLLSGGCHSAQLYLPSSECAGYMCSRLCVYTSKNAFAFTPWHACGRQRDVQDSGLFFHHVILREGLPLPEPSYCGPFSGSH